MNTRVVQRFHRSLQNGAELLQSGPTFLQIDAPVVAEARRLKNHGGRSAQPDLRLCRQGQQCFKQFQAIRFKTPDPGPVPAVAVHGIVGSQGNHHAVGIERCHRFQFGPDIGPPRPQQSGTSYPEIFHLISRTQKLPHTSRIRLSILLHPRSLRDTVPQASDSQSGTSSCPGAQIAPPGHPGKDSGTKVEKEATIFIF